MPVTTFPKTFWQTTDRLTARLWKGDSLSILKRLPPKRVHMCVTSPPYWGLRDYGTAQWEGGDPKCSHDAGKIEKRTRETYNNSGNYTSAYIDKIEMGLAHMGRECLKCGAHRIDSQLGSEERPDCLGWARGENCAEKDWANACHVCRMVLVFREVYRVLRDDGTLWLNYGDTYAQNGYTESRGTDKISEANEGKDGAFRRRILRQGNEGTFDIKGDTGLAQGNLVGVPWRVALALQADGWILRNDNIWHKSNPMPESVKNRCTKAHEYLFMFSKTMDYFFDMEAIKTEAKQEWNAAQMIDDPESGSNDAQAVAQGLRTRGGTTYHSDKPRNDANKRTVWTIATYSYPGAHFATFSPKLITPCINAGTSEKGCCAKCGAPWVRRVEMTEEYQEVLLSGRAWVDDSGKPDEGKKVNRQQKGHVSQVPQKYNTIGWEPSCTCNGYFVTRVVKVNVKRRKDKGKDTYDRDHSQTSNRNGMDSVSLDPNVETIEVEKKKKVREYRGFIPLEEHPIAPCVVLDPFIGSGTTARVCMELERRVWGIELSEEYLTKHCIERVKAFCYTRPAYVHLVKGV